MKKRKLKVRILFFYFFNLIEPGIFEKNILNKKYKGKSDRVALYKMFQESWSKNLSKKK